MSLVETCDLVYVLLLERIERRVLVERQMAMQALTAGADVELPSVQDAWEDFDAALVEPPRQATQAEQDRADLLLALGIGR